jgi:hypothetical protein
MTRAFLSLAVLALFFARASQAYLSPTVELSGKVSDFDDRYLFLDATTERYRVDRASVPASVELRPGTVVSFEAPLDSLKILPLASSAPRPPAHYKPPRKRDAASRSSTE